MTLVHQERILALTCSSKTRNAASSLQRIQAWSSVSSRGSQAGCTIASQRRSVKCGRRRLSKTKSDTNRKRANTFHPRVTTATAGCWSHRDLVSKRSGRTQIYPKDHVQAVSKFPYYACAKTKTRIVVTNVSHYPNNTDVFFTSEERPKILKEFNDPPLKFTDIGYILGERWRELKPERRKKYEGMAEGDKLRHEREMKEYKKRSPLESSPPSPGDQVGFSSHNYYADEHEASYTGEVDLEDVDNVVEGTDYEHHFNGAQV